ncbi:MULTISPECIES: PLDc N-terminal domain-containing protein [Bizionia]|uniref:Cardiolipin synthase N-terminal domain-containing protein n=1 Tax=Bizionia algoritergicola TaxID=291187 RepID=A0A5D0R2T7_9FLAO|nr:hypothetical protein BAA08_11095 [Bizionia sp. APA-3]TYB74864.1 hypothetical protein ES675_01630 [Bizionia algoritergicola]
MTVVNPFVLIISAILALVLFLTSLVFIFKNEQKPLFKLLWTLFVIFVPIFGSIIYIIKYFVEKKGMNHTYAT